MNWVSESPYKFLWGADTSFWFSVINSWQRGQRLNGGLHARNVVHPDTRQGNFFTSDGMTTITIKQDYHTFTVSSRLGGAKHFNSAFSLWLLAILNLNLANGCSFCFRLILSSGSRNESSPNIYLCPDATSQQPTSQTTWLKVTPHCEYCNRIR
jgi:hypothetical protein